MDWIMRLYENATFHKISPTCFLHVKHTFDNFIKGSLWALKMFDSSTKVPGSILMGNLFDFGNFDECQEVTVHEHWGSFVGQHCVLQAHISIETNETQSSLLPMKDIPLTWSLCVPSTCSALDIEHLVENILQHNITVIPEMCHTDGSQPFRTADWIAISIFLLIASLCLTGTVYSMLPRDQEKQNKWLNAFSWYNNGKSLLSTKLSADTLPVLHGIRFLSIAWVVMAHSYEYSGYLPQLNYLDGLKAIRTWKYLIIVNSALAVDTFMVLSALLLSYCFMKTMERGHRFNLPLFYLHRLLRIWPVLGILVMFQATLMTRLGSGPLWSWAIVNEQSRYCKNNWWSTMLFVQNYVHVKQMCLPITWFLAVDMQLYWISPILLFLLLKKPRLAVGVILGACAMGILVTFQQTYYYQDNASIVVTRGVTDDRYYQTHTRFVAWLIGLLCGYALHKTTDWRNRVASGRDSLPQKVVICGWTCSAVLLIAVIHWIYPLQQEDHEYNAIEHSLYLALSRPLWALAISWIIFACVSGYGGFVNTFLTWKAMIPLSRITFCIYLIHYIILCVVMANTKASGYMSATDEIVSLFGYLVLSMILSLFMTLLIETPLLAFEKILLRRQDTSSKISSEVGPELHKTNIKEL